MMQPNFNCSHLILKCIKMKTKFLPVSCFIIICFVCCQKANNNDYQSNGIITEPDIRMCPCCGGWYIQIDGSTYEFDSLPSKSNMNLQKDSFPILVKLDWQLSNQIACPDKRITVIRIIKE